MTFAHVYQLCYSIHTMQSIHWMNAIINIDLCNNYHIIWIPALPCLYLPTHRLSPCNTKHEATRLAGHNRTPVQFLTNGLTTTTRATYTAGQQNFAPFCQAINASAIPISEHTFFIHNTWQLSLLLTPLSRSTSMPSSTCMCQQDYLQSLATNLLYYKSSWKVCKEIKQFSIPQEFVYQSPYKSCNLPTTCSSTNPIHTPKS